ncbi:MAG TPA: tRNA lysidine(34) synthetase TilS [Stellaceae bacterium]|nr:tRNA lysidine(34) synthetase TilS [Stellaceae bacterium]
MTEGAAVSAAEFAALIAPLGPFEPAPLLAVAVSGGADSMALALLAHGWAEARGGAIVALTVDHRLRPEATAEAAQVGAWLKRRGIAHRILVREGALPEHGLQAGARGARYRLLEKWCRSEGVLHLLVAHQREDQAETVLLRMARGSGLDGLAGMAGIVERADCRRLRPLLGIARPRLAATLTAMGQGWIEDPSNQNSAYARVRMRSAARDLAELGLDAERLAGTAARLGRARAALEREVAALLARAASIHPAGFARLDPASLRRAPDEVGLRALAGVLALVGGGDFPPRLERLERLYGDLPQGLGGGRTLGGCRILPRRGGFLVCRELSAVAPPIAATPGTMTAWDGRFRLHLPPTAPEGLRFGALGGAPVEGRAPVPSAARGSLPALHDRRSVVAVPALGYLRSASDAPWIAASTLVFRPTRPLSGAGFTVV